MFYICVYKKKKKKLFKIKIDDILFKINYDIRKIKWIKDITNWKKKNLSRPWTQKHN